MAIILDEIDKLQLDMLNADWAQGIYYSEFLEFGEFPTEYESFLECLDIPSTFRHIIKSIQQWLSDDSEMDEDKSWSTLSRRVEYEKLLALIAYFIDFGGKNILSREHRNNAILASRLYYKLLSISGFKAYNIYHSQLFAQSLTCLGFLKGICDNGDNYMNTKQLTYEVNLLINDLQKFVKDLRTVIEPLHLSPTDMNFEDILGNLVDVTGCAIVNKLNVDKIELAKVTRVIYDIIDILICDRENEADPSAIHLLFKSILPKLISASMDCKNANNLVRASYVTYSGLLLTKYGKAALDSYMILLQHLCYTADGLEKAEVRSARVSLVIGLMSMLPHKSHKVIVKWLLELSTNAKVPHRHIALEMLAKLLSNEPEEDKSIELQAANEVLPADPPDPNAPEQNPEANPETTEGQAANNDTRASVIQSTASLEAPLQPRPEGSDDSSQDSQETVNLEDGSHDTAGLLRQRPHSVPYPAILRALYDRLDDVSGTLRTRAMTILTECMLSKRPGLQAAIQKLDGAEDSDTVGRLTACGARAAVDPRAVVRKAGVALLRAAVARDHSPLHSQLIVSLCRDASILVRSSAVGTLGELLQGRPSPAGVDSFLTGCMHQLADPEAKIQEQVATLIQQCVFDRLKKYSADVAGDPLPWMFLDGVVRHNMRRQLQNACGLLLKSSNCINVRLVDILSSHLCCSSDARDLQVLVALTSVAAHLTYSDVAFILQYYYDLRISQGRDIRLMSLTLELLTVWSQYIVGQERTDLRDNLIQSVTLPGPDGCRITSAALAAHLDPANIHWATEMMQIAERRALARTDVEEWVRAADLSLVCSLPPSPALIALFENTLNDPPLDWSAAEWGACAAGAGRLGLRWRAAAEALAPRLARLLRSHAPLAPQCNALLALADLCSRYTCIVEPLMGSLCACLQRDAPPALRRTAARALTRLLLAGFLRLRTALHYTYCALLADPQPDVREPAEYYVTCCLPTEHIYHHFTDCVLHFTSDSSYNLSFDDRQLIYDVMLQRMSLVQKLNIQCRLAREVLTHAADVCDEISSDETCGDDLPAELNAALLDTITLLCGPRMKLPKKPQRDGEADIDDLQERVTTNIVSHKMKSTVAEVVVPAVLRLYARVRGRGGQVAAYLVKIANELLADYRAEIEELIENDEELVERVRQFQQTIGQQPSFGNCRNLVTASAPPEPDTPRRRPPARAPRAARSPPRKRALNM